MTREEFMKGVEEEYKLTKASLEKRREILAGMFNVDAQDLWKVTHRELTNYERELLIWFNNTVREATKVEVRLEMVKRIVARHGGMEV